LAGFWSAWLYVANQRENRYANNLKVAYLNNRDGSFDESKQVLASSPTEFRDWEWHYLQRLNYVSPYSRWRYGQIGHHYGPRLVMSTTGSKMVLVYNPLPAEPKKPIDYRVPDQPPKITSSRIMVLDIQSGKEAFSLEVPGNAMVACDTDSSEEKLYVYQGDVIQRYRLESGQSDWSVPIENPVELDPWDTDARLELIDQGRTLVATLEKGKRLDFWDTESKQKVPPGSRPNLNRGGMRGTENDLCVVFSPDDQWIYSTATRKTINQWKAQTGERSRTFHANFVTNSDRYSNYFSALHCEGSMIETSPTGSTLLGVMDGRFSEFDLSKDETRLKTSDIDRVGFLSILEDNKLGKNYLLVNPLKRNQMREYSNTDLIQLLDAQTGKLFWEKVIPGPDRYSAADGFKKSTESLSSYLKTLNPNQIKISPNGQWIAGPLKQNAIIILNRESGRIIREIPIKQEGRFSICWTIDSKRLIHGGNDGRLHIWNPFSGIELLSIMAHPQGVTSLAVTPDGSKIVSGGKDGLIRIWDASSTY
jgi:WD40 repeat protein